MTTTTKISFKKFYTLIGVLAAHTRQDAGEVKRTWVMQASGRQTDSVSTLRAQYPAQYLRMMEELERTVNRITEKREDEMDALRKRVLRVGCELVRKQMGVVENPINYVKEMIFRQTRGVPFNKVDRETLNGIIFKWNRILKGAKEMVGERMFGVN